MCIYVRVKPRGRWGSVRDITHAFFLIVSNFLVLFRIQSPICLFDGHQKIRALKHLTGSLSPSLSLSLSISLSPDAVPLCAHALHGPGAQLGAGAAAHLQPATAHRAAIRALMIASMLLLSFSYGTKGKRSRDGEIQTERKAREIMNSLFHKKDFSF